MAENGANSVNFKLYTPDGVEVLFHIVPETMGWQPGELGVDHFAQSGLSFVKIMLNSGWLAQRPSLESGEDVFTIDAICRSTKLEDDGRETPIIAFYPVNFAHPSVKKYMNTPEDVATFERVTGLRIADLPDYIGKDAINRHEADKRQLQFVIVVKPFDIIWKANPNYVENSTKPKRYFVRYKSDVPVQPGTPVEQTNGHDPAIDKPAQPKGVKRQNATDRWTAITKEAIKHPHYQRDGKPNPPHVSATYNLLKQSGHVSDELIADHAVQILRQYGDLREGGADEQTALAEMTVPF